eukprot:TRINITY_DN76794_c0_g1_i1.p1 TRINITY_DN76794_c0_g1~~TRINITY_DN76794_c0_g1_i1.p1  ORF type:complete len:202 (+),score=43.93 TRINITY_DN76794_c0_g1_i1:90-695(+)
MKAVAVSSMLVMAAGYGGEEVKPSAAELRRYEGSTDCTGNYTVLNTDVLDSCSPKIAPAPASIKVEYVNETTYASYHYQGVQDCSGSTRKHLADYSVGSCETYKDDGFSQMRAWVRSPAPSDGTCAAPGDCGRAYQACCAGEKAMGKGECACHLRNGTGTAISPDCGKCGKAYVVCCLAFQLKGFPCNCDIKDPSAGALLI